jgi:hypothetical protein
VVVASIVMFNILELIMEIVPNYPTFCFLGRPGGPLALPPPSCRWLPTRESAAILYGSGASLCPAAAPTDDVSDKLSCLAASEDHAEARLAAPLAASEDLAVPLTVLEDLARLIA